MTKLGKRDISLVALACFLFGASALVGCTRSETVHPSVPRPRGTVTFNKDIAPILFQHCALCHRPGQSAPFSLLSYQAAKKHATEIALATQRRFMPPWLPEPGYGDFLDERRLEAEQIGLIEQWVAEGTAEGDPAVLPSLPKFSEGWQLGEPDLVLQMPEPYQLGADGKDLYRNFVLRVPVSETRFVQALEFHPNSPSVHHVRILLDATGQSRHLDGQDGEAGFGGMSVPAKFPPGHMLTWVPGKTRSKEPEGLAWVLEKGTDLVLQIHMRRTGRLEMIQPVIGLYFTNQPPTKVPARIGLLSQLIDIPAGDSHYVVERDFGLPVDVDVLAVLPHLHNLGKEVQGYALLPNGKKQWLLWIKQWDFNWQGEYLFRQPVFLPRGTKVHMQYTYDNSAQNVRNPNHPPQRVTFGPQSTDEMAELWLQLLPRRPEDLAVLQSAHRTWSTEETVAYYEKQLHANPGDAAAHFALGKALGPLGSIDEAMRHFQSALELQPNLTEAHYYLGMTYYSQRRWSDARAEYETTLRLNPNHFKAHDGLGLLFLQTDDLAQAEAHFKSALGLNANDAVARQHLEDLARSRK